MTKIFGDKQQAEASDNSFIAQSQRDTIVHVGLSYTDVKEIFTDLHERNFPVLREEARQASISAIQDYSKVFFDRIGKIEDYQKVQSRLSNPDVQAAVNTSIMHVGRMTEKSNAQVLAELLAKKIEEEQDSGNYLLNEAIEISTSIDMNTIRFAAFSLAVMNLGPALPKNIQLPDEVRKTLYTGFFVKTVPGFIKEDGKPIDTSYLTYKGVLAGAGGLLRYSTPLIEIITEKTNLFFEEYKSNQELTSDDEFTRKLPGLSHLIKSYGFKTVDEFDAAPLSMIGFTIADAYLRSTGILQG